MAEEMAEMLLVEMVMPEQLILAVAAAALREIIQEDWAAPAS